jgi:hypothetical protein
MPRHLIPRNISPLKKNSKKFKEDYIDIFHWL